MPSFSLPGTSIGTEEAENYLVARSEGVSRARAAKNLLDRGMSPGYPKSLELMLEVAIRRAKALFPDAADPHLCNLAWIYSLCGPTTQPLFTLNRYALNHRVNAVCFSRSSVLLFGRNGVGGKSSHKHHSAASGGLLVDSFQSTDQGVTP